MAGGWVVGGRVLQQRASCGGGGGGVKVVVVGLCLGFGLVDAFLDALVDGSDVERLADELGGGAQRVGRVRRGASQRGRLVERSMRRLLVLGLGAVR